MCVGASKPEIPRFAETQTNPLPADLANGHTTRILKIMAHPTEDSFCSRDAAPIALPAVVLRHVRSSRTSRQHLRMVPHRQPPRHPLHHYTHPDAPLVCPPPRRLLYSLRPPCHPQLPPPQPVP